MMIKIGIYYISFRFFIIIIFNFVYEANRISSLNKYGNLFGAFASTYTQVHVQCAFCGLIYEFDEWMNEWMNSLLLHSWKWMRRILWMNFNEYVGGAENRYTYNVIGLSIILRVRIINCTCVRRINWLMWLASWPSGIFIRSICALCMSFALIFICCLFV